MKYKGIELEGLDKKVKLSHSRVMETDEGTDWIDKLLTCDKAALTPTQFHEVSALSSVINMDYQICNGGISQYVFNGYHEYRAPYSDDDVAQLDLNQQFIMLCRLVAFGGEHLPIPLLCGLPYAFEGIVFREDAEEVAEYWRSASCRGASQKRVLKFLELHESHILRVRAGLDEVAAGYDGPSVVCPHHRVLRRQTGEGVDVRAEVLRYRRAGVAGLQRLVLIQFELLSELQHVHVAIVYDFPLEVGTLVAVDENLATREINHAHASIRTARSTSVPMRHSPR